MAEQERLFGTDGIRQQVGTYPFTIVETYKIGYALGKWAVRKYGQHCTLLLGHDTRESCAWLKATMKAGILSHPIRIYDAGVQPTPVIANLVTRQKICAWGLIISASHNPYHDNGLKIIDSIDGKLSLHDELAIEKIFYSDNVIPSYKHFGTDRPFFSTETKYINNIISMFAPDMLSELTIVLDCANGATSFLAPKIFTLLGAKVHTLNASPNGRNINFRCGSTDPKTLQNTVIENNADIGIAFDGDGDRVVIVDMNGNVKNGDDILSILMNNKRYKGASGLVGTIMSNMGLQNLVEKNNQTFYRTAVGDKYVIRKLKDENLQLGGEPSGHIIMGDYLFTGDGIYAALKVLETIIQTNNWACTTFVHTPNRLINVPIKNRKSLTDGPLADIIHQHEQNLPEGRILVRYSGTEPLLRVMVESDDGQVAHNAAEQLATILQTHLHS
ncbi:phosphoglucosamine mutase [bacterium]|jgi:phosphoglucosamine mutase|nr:phosphoglucosamine mutase [bacterium]MBT4577610.1 phosphoglucosamine mutase [bacterium]MBT5346146.1 phosphoglucosamine mutase [bacterium]MBT6131415.1 phosphoglucosamine mutase [bacterium]MBT6528592.1 phosphoglucosamine mutase [bacterium]